MSDMYKRSHRQHVRDVNSGRLSPKVAEATRSSGSATASRAQDREVDIDLGPEGSTLIKKALIRGAGVVGEQLSREAKRKQILDGRVKAGTEEGRQEIAKRKDGMLNKIFGPDTTIRAAEEQIVKDSVDRLYNKQRADLDTFGETMTQTDWENHTQKGLDEMLSKYDYDEDLKDTIALNYSANSAVLARDYTKKRYVFEQKEARTAFTDSIIQTSQIVAEDMNSGDPDRAMDAEMRMAVAFKRRPNQTDDAYYGSIAGVLKNDLAKGNSNMFDYVSEMGILGGMSAIDKVELEEAYTVYQTKYDAKVIESLNRVDYLAGSGDVAGVTALAESLNKEMPGLFGAAGLRPLIEKAETARIKQAEKAAEDATVVRGFRMGDASVDALPASKAVPAMTTMLADIADEGIRAAGKEQSTRAGTMYDENAPITDQMRQEHLIRNPESWIPKVASRKHAVPMVQSMVDRALSKFGNPDLTEEQAQQINVEMATMQKLQQADPRFAKKYIKSDDDGFALETYNRMSRSGENPVTIAKTVNRALERKNDGVDRPALTQDALEQAVTMSATAFEDIKLSPLSQPGLYVEGLINAGLELPQAFIPFTDSTPVDDFNKATSFSSGSRAELEAHMRTNIQLGYDTYGNLEDAMTFARAQVDREGTVVGNRFIAGGAVLDQGVVSFDAYLSALNDDPVHQQILAESTAEIPIGTDLREGEIIVHPDGRAATIVLDGKVIQESNWLLGRKEIREKAMIEVKVPTDPNQVPKSKSQEALGWMQEKLSSLKSGREAALAQLKVPDEPKENWTPEKAQAEQDAAPKADKFEDTLANVENGIKSGFDKASGTWKPHKSREGGTDTIAYGHKLTAVEAKSNSVSIGGKQVSLANGLTEDQAKQLFRQDIDKHKGQVRKSIRDFDDMPKKYQDVLTNIAFNIGHVSETGWPELLKAMRRGDDAAVRREMVTSYKDEAGKRHQLQSRATQIADAVGLGS